MSEFTTLLKRLLWCERSAAVGGKQCSASVQHASWWEWGAAFFGDAQLLVDDGGENAAEGQHDLSDGSNQGEHEMTLRHFVNFNEFSIGVRTSEFEQQVLQAELDRKDNRNCEEYLHAIADGEFSAAAHRSTNAESFG